jgi:RNA-directed DNA polymerase
MNKGTQLSGDGQKPAESVERRGLAEGNTRGAPTAETQSSGTVTRGLEGVREAARRDKRLQFTALLHHIDVSLLRESYERLKRGAAPGVDDVRWTDYQEGVLERLTELHERIHKGSYVGCPVRGIPTVTKSGISRFSFHGSCLMPR